MSKPHISPYRRNAYNNNRPEQPNRSPYRQQPYKLAEKSKLSHSLIANEQTNQKRMNNPREEMIRATEKKRAYEAGTIGHTRLDTLVQQNKFLLTENNELANLLNDRSRVIIALEQKLEQQIAQEVQTLEEIEFEKNRFLEEYALKMREHSARNECLMNEIAQLNEDIYQLELKKSSQIEHIKQSYSRQHRIQLDNILNNHAQTVQIMQIENNKLKEIINNRDNQIICLNHELRSTNERLKSKCEELEKNLAHVLHMKKLELSQQKIEYEKIIEDIKRECDKLQEISSAQYENQIKRVKKELLIKQVEVEKLGNDISSNHIDSQIKINELYQKKADLENQISEMEKYQKKLLFEETQRIKNLAQAEIENTETFNKQLLDNLKSQNAKLIQLNETRANEVTKLYVQLEDFRFKHERQCDDLRLQIENLKALLHSEKQTYDEQNETMKVKLAQLRHADIHSLQQYYQNEIATMTQDLQLKEQIIQENRDKLHAEIQEKTEMRKNFQYQINELMIKIGHLENRIAVIISQKKDQLANVGSQMQLTSMTLLRTAQEKQKYAIFSQAEKQRLQKIIQSKDRQIDELNEKVKMLIENHNDQTNNKNDEIQILKKTIEELQMNLRKEKFFLENEIKKKEAIRENDKAFYESQIAKIKKQTQNEYNRALAQLTSQKNLIDQQRIRLKKTERDLASELKQQKQFRQQQNIDKQIALSESMNRINIQKQALEGSLKAYYMKQMNSKERQIKDLRQQISELNNDIRSHIQREQKLEQKLRALLQSQQKLRDMEQRVIALGQDNNLIKNLSQIVKNRRR